MRKSLLSASIVSLVFGFGVAAAQEAEETPSYVNEPATAEEQAPVEEEAGMEEESGMETAQLEGQNVFDANGQPVGTIESVTTAEDGTEQAILSVGGFLGLGAKKISVGVDELQPNADGSGYTIAMTAEEVEAAPEYEGAEKTEDQPMEQ